MRILLLNQTFYPDVVATAQYLTSLGEALAARGNDVHVLSSRRGYDDPSRVFPAREQYGNLEIRRVGGTRLGKGAKWRRMLDFASFLLLAGWHALTMPQVDVTVALTSPPLVAALAALRCRLRGGRFVYWVMDLNPDEALAAGWLRPGVIAWLLERISRYTLLSAARVVVLDRYMRDRVLAKGIPADRVCVIPPWSLDGHAYWDAEGRARFRQRHGLVGKYVVMYSGNHSPVHPLDVLLETAVQLRDDSRFCFVFAGGGSEFGRLEQLAREHALQNVRFLPYQPLQALSGSLSSADLQTVVLGPHMVGLIHPSKLYNILAIGSPLLYIGPFPSHVTDAMERDGRANGYVHMSFGEASRLAEWLVADWPNWKETGGSHFITGCEDHAQARRLPFLIEAIEAS